MWYIHVHILNRSHFIVLVILFNPGGEWEVLNPLLVVGAVVIVGDPE